MYRGLWWGNLRERVYLEEPDEEGRTILRWIFRKMDVDVWTGSNWLSWQQNVNAVIKHSVP